MKEPDRKPHAVLDLSSRRLKALKIERLLELPTQPAHMRLLEIGTGSGGIAYYFANHHTRDFDVTAVDVKDQRLIKEGYTFHLVTDTTLPFPENSFDIVITNHVIEHVGELGEQRHHLSEVKRVLKSSGTAYLAVPNRWMLIEPHYRLAFLSWLPRRLRTPYLRLMMRGERYDCEPLSLQSLESLLVESEFTFENLGTQALRETILLEGAKSLSTKLVSTLPDQVLDLLAPIIPTLVYRLTAKS